MPRRLFKARYVLTMSDSPGVLQEGAVITEGKTIREVGSYETLARMGPFEEEIGSLEWDVLMPGFINAHHHCVMGFRDGIPDLPLELWLLYIYGDYKRGMTEEELYVRTVWVAHEMVRNGITSVLDLLIGNPRLPMEGAEAMRDAYREVGLRVALAPMIRDRGELTYGPEPAFVERLSPGLRDRVRSFLAPQSTEAVLASWESAFRGLDEGRDGRVRVFMAPQGPQWVTEELLRRAKTLARDCGTGIQTHLLETRYQMLYSRRVLGKSLVRQLADLGFLGEEVSLAHCVWLTKEDIQVLAQEGATAVHNPSQNLRLSDGIAPVTEMLGEGAKVAVGTDGVGIHDSNDLLSDLRLGMFLQRAPRVAHRPPVAKEWLEILYRGGASALGLKDRAGALSPGGLADLVLLDGKSAFASPFTHPRMEPAEVVLHRAQGRDVHTVVVDGEVLVRGGRHVRVDPEKVRERFKQLASARFPWLEEDEKMVGELSPHVARHYADWDETSPPETPNVYRYNLI
ncbi:MAG: amidohydrolase family protein [Nitrospinota bacterium]